MLITELKNTEVLASQLTGKVFVINCHGCKEIRFPEAEANEFQKTLCKTGSVTTEYICNPDNLKVQLNKHAAALEEADVIAVFSCGVGVQTVAEMADMSVFAAANSLNYTGHHGMALTKKACDACAQCYLTMTGGICPVVDCSKSLLNGQCGGAKNGKCEVSPDKDCAWEKIQQRLSAQGRLNELTSRPVQLRDYSKVSV